MRDRLLIRHFLQRFLDNDLISPHADRHETLAVVSAALISSSLFVTVLLSLKYLFAPFQSPGRTALLALDDRVFYVACSMLVMALVAVVTWDALALDVRDTSILGPLPIPHGIIVRAKLAAIVLFASGFAIALNVVPSIVHSSLMVAKLPISALAATALILIHGSITLAAGAFGFVLVLGVREFFHMFLGTTRFSRASTVLQASLVVFLGTMLLLLPGLSSDIARSWFMPGRLTAYALPPLWFLGLHETLAGNLIDRLPRGVLPARILESEGEATALYRSLQPQFRQLGRVAVAALAIAVVVAVAAYAWNSRRLPAPAVGRNFGRRRVRAVWVWLAQHLLVRRPVAQAGFFFTLQSLTRSVPHRLAMATCVAVGVAVVIVSLHGIDIREAHDIPSTPIALFAVQTVLIILLLTGFRHAVRVPAELRANWTFHLSWSGNERSYLAGVKRAAVFGLCLPTLCLLFPFHVLALGPRVALVHLACGLLFALVLLDALLLGFRKLPFACAYVPSGELKTLGPICLLAFSSITYALAWLERFTLGEAHGTAIFVASLGMLLLSLRAVDHWQRRNRIAMDFEELPAPATQRLDLSG